MIAEVEVRRLQLSSVASSRAEPSSIEEKPRRREDIPKELCLGRSLPRLNYAAVRDDARAQIQTETLRKSGLGSRV
jgi:hypothetical protein